MSEFLPNHYLSIPVYKHHCLPVYLTAEFDFYRCVPFDNSFYGKTVSELHSGNLRNRKDSNRYSKLFQHQKVSYWADSSTTARAEMQKHGNGKNLLTFYAYDDATASFPTLKKERDFLCILDGRDEDFHEILLKDDRNKQLSVKEKKLLSLIEEEAPDCLAYWSVARKGGINYLFFEKGFKKLAIKELSLRLGEEKSKNHKTIYCAGTSDYTAWLESYGDYFMPKTRIKHDNNYEQTLEYKKRKEISEYWYGQYHK